MIEIIDGDLLEAKEKYIAHQTNSISNRAGGLAYDLFKRFPYADIYAPRTSPDEPGTIVISGNGEDQRYIIHLNAQYYPGESSDTDSEIDGSKAREKYFHECLLKVARIENLESIALPYFIGCGLAGGNWNYYYGTICNFEKYVSEKFGTKVLIYRKDI